MAFDFTATQTFILTIIILCCIYVKIGRKIFAF